MSKTILMIEDEEHFATGLAALLKAKGYAVVVATDGEEGLKAARDSKPDLIILDVMLPKMDGFKICRHLKFDEKYGRIPILMLTARAENKDIDQGKAAGADAYMLKTSKPSTVLETIETLLKS